MNLVHSTTTIHSLSLSLSLSLSRFYSHSLLHSLFTRLVACPSFLFQFTFVPHSGTTTAAATGTTSMCNRGRSSNVSMFRSPNSQMTTALTYGGIWIHSSPPPCLMSPVGSPLNIHSVSHLFALKCVNYRHIKWTTKNILATQMKVQWKFILYLNFLKLSSSLLKDLSLRSFRG